MLLSNRFLSHQALSKRGFLKAIRAGAAIGCVALLASCTVKPLYSDGPAGDNVSKVLSNVAVNAVDSRVAQEVRNQLTFKLHRGGAKPSSPDYRVALTVSSSEIALATVDRLDTDGGRPTARRLSVTASYVLTKVDGGETIASGKRVAAASYDLTRQRYTSERAAIDAENRAAREAAESVYLAIAAKLAK